MYSFRKSLLALVGLLALVAVFAALPPLVGKGQGQAEDKNPLRRDPRRSFYLTPDFYDGSQALTACAEGYHMASLWEIFDPSNLKYDTQLGLSNADSGSGPPSFNNGWIRTGFTATGTSLAGQSNCEAWTSASSTDAGTTVALPHVWSLTNVTVVSPWIAEVRNCGSSFHVWCVQD